MAKREKGNLPTARAKVSIVANAQSFGLLPDSVANSAFDLAFAARFDNDQLQPEALRRSF